MADLIYLIPLAPLVGFLILFTTLGNLPKSLVAVTGVGSITISALVVLLLALEFLADRQPLTTTIYTWISVGGFNSGVSFYV
ncbi:MAG: NADH-quinone oxidoreductase subunit L, partial [Pseudomonadota bacterium]|nr:NADH-quinone oxidoreductase subunit L [Pseudomonadota bacterium]